MFVRWLPLGGVRGVFGGSCLQEGGSGVKGGGVFPADRQLLGGRGDDKVGPVQPDLCTQLFVLGINFIAFRYNLLVFTNTR